MRPDGAWMPLPMPASSHWLQGRLITRYFSAKDTESLFAMMYMTATLSCHIFHITFHISHFPLPEATPEVASARVISLMLIAIVISAT